MERRAIPEVQPAGAVRHYESRAVIAQAPSFSVVRIGTYLAEVAHAVHDGHVVLPGQLYEAVVDYRDPLGKPVRNAN